MRHERPGFGSSRKVKRLGVVAAAICLSLLVSGPLTGGEAGAGDETGGSADTLIDVGPARLNFRIVEGGGPTILLEAGGGLDLTEWTALMPLIAIETGATVVAYDRAGFGKSDLPEGPCDMREEAAWLWNGLHQLGLDRSLLLVGHSYGGWMIRLIASEHPDEICGMVFIDPFTTEFVDALTVEYLDQHPMTGKLPFDTSHPESLTDYQRACMRMVAGGLGPKVEIMRETSIPDGIPVRIITSGLTFLPKPEEQEAWRLAHEKMAASVDGAVLIVAEESGHMVPWNQPQLVVEAIAGVVEENERSRDTHHR